MKVFVDADSIAYAAAYAEHPTQMEQTVDGYINGIKEACQSNDIVGFVENPEGKNNYRKFVAVTRVYKGNRAGKEKPPWLTEAKQYLRQKHGFNFVNAMESEDACSISAHALGLDKCYIAAIDKDLHQIPATFYDYKYKRWKSVTAEEAEYNLYAQVLSGDSTDNIPGVAGMGGKKAEAALMEADHLPTMCAQVYKDKGYGYEYFLEQARLIYILRRHGDVFTPVSRETWEAL